MSWCYYISFILLKNWPYVTSWVNTYLCILPQFLCMTVELMSFQGDWWISPVLDFLKFIYLLKKIFLSYSKGHWGGVHSWNFKLFFFFFFISGFHMLLTSIVGLLFGWFQHHICAGSFKCLIFPMLFYALHAGSSVPSSLELSSTWGSGVQKLCGRTYRWSGEREFWELLRRGTWCNIYRKGSTMLHQINVWHSKYDRYLRKTGRHGS